MALQLLDDALAEQRIGAAVLAVSDAWQAQRGDTKAVQGNDAVDLATLIDRAIALLSQDGR